MRWVAAITACIVLSLTAMGLSLAALPSTAGSIDAEVEATLGAPLPADHPASQS